MALRNLSPKGGKGLDLMPMRRAVSRSQILKENQREKRGGEGRGGEEDESEVGFRQCMHLCWFEIHR